MPKRTKRIQPNHKEFFKELAALCDRHAVVMGDEESGESIPVYFRDGMLKNNKPGTCAMLEGGSCEITATYFLTEVNEDHRGIVAHFHEPVPQTAIKEHEVSVPIGDHE